MTIINRVGRLFKADLHGIIDCLEDPEVILRQAIRDMEEELASDEQAVQRTKEALLQMKKKQAKLSQQLPDYDSQLEMCLGSNKEELAKSVMRKRLADEKLIAAFFDRINESENQLLQSQQRLLRRREQLSAIRQKAELFAPLTPVETRNEEIRHRLDVTDDEVELALLREREKHAGRRVAPKAGAS